VKYVYNLCYGKGYIMNFSTDLFALLNQLKAAALTLEISRENLLSAMTRLLLWLNSPENDNDKNCRQIDHFVTLEIMVDKRFDAIPEDIKNILFDMGTTLHDTHTEPETAKNFASTPTQLLDRVQQLSAYSGHLDEAKK